MKFLFCINSLKTTRSGFLIKPFETPLPQIPYRYNFRANCGNFLVHHKPHNPEIMIWTLPETCWLIWIRPKCKWMGVGLYTHILYKKRKNATYPRPNTKSISYVNRRRLSQSQVLLLGPGLFVLSRLLVEIYSRE